jgi:hypothetical protein
MHRPTWTLKSGYSNFASQQYLAPIFEGSYPGLNGKTVDAVFMAHSHNYQRYIHNEVYYVVSGGAGTALYGVGSGEWPFIQIAYEVYHFCIIDIDGRTFRQKAVDDDGNVIDEFEITKDPVSINAPSFETEQKSPKPGNLTLSVSPNPFSTSVDIKISITNGKLKISNLKFDIFNIIGKLVHQSHVSHRSSLVWHAQDQPPGIYIVKVKEGNRIITKRITLIK